MPCFEFSLWLASPQALAPADMSTFYDTVISDLCFAAHMYSYLLRRVFLTGAPSLLVCHHPPKEEKENIADIWEAYHDERTDSLGTVMPGEALAELKAKAKKW